MDDIITGSTISLFLSLSQTHTHTCTHNAYTHTESPLQLTLPQRHLSLRMARWWMQVGGWYACAHFCVRLSVRMVSRESVKREESSMHYTECSYQCVLFYSIPGSCFLPLAEPTCHVLYCVVPQYLPHFAVSRDLQTRCYQQCKVPPVLFRASPLSEQVADCGTRAKTVSVQSVG